MLVLFAGRARAFQHAAPARVETRAFAKKAKKAPKASAPRRAELPPGAATPKLIVFDLDNTLWSPELYQLRKKPKANKDVRLCAGAVDALYDLATGDWPRGELGADAILGAAPARQSIQHCYPWRTVSDSSSHFETTHARA